MSLEITQPVPGNQPILLLDIDGVFTVLPDEQLSSEYSVHPKPLFRFNPAHGAAITKLAEYALPIYISDWQAQSHDHIGAVHNWPPFNWIDSYKYGTQDSDRRRASANYLLAQHPLVWIDDELSEADSEWASERTEHSTPTLLIKPDAVTGVRAHELAKVQHWLANTALNQ